MCNYRPQKEEANRCRITVGGDRVEYPGDVSTKTAELMTINCLLSSLLSKLRAQFMTSDMNNFYLKKPLDIPEYMRIIVNTIPS